MNNSRAKGITLVIFGAMLWGVSGTVAQFLFQKNNFTPEWLVVIRLTLSGILLLSYGLFKKDLDVKDIWKNKKDRITLISFSVLGMLTCQYTYFAAIKHSNAATATILEYLSPIIITCYMVFHNKKLPKLSQICAILLAIIGSFLIITKGNINSLSISKLALFYGLCAAFSNAIYTLLSANLLKKYSSITIVGWGMLIGGLAFSFINPPWKFSGVLSLSTVSCIGFVVIFGTLIAFYCYLDSLNYILPTESSTLACVEPVSTAFFSVIWLKISFGLADFIGTACIITAIIILSYFNKNTSEDNNTSENNNKLNLNT